MKTAGKLFFVLCFLLFTFDGVYSQEESRENILWKMALLKKSGSVSREAESVPFRQSITMLKRDTYQLYLAFGGHGSCYVIQENDEGKLPLVFKKSVLPGDRLILPGEGRGFKAVELPGTTRLYVIVSARPRPNLERLMEQHGPDPYGTSLERSLLSEVLAIRRSLPSPSDLPVTPVPPTETDPAMKGQLWLFEGRDSWVVTITVRVQ